MPILEKIELQGSPEYQGEKVSPRLTVIELLKDSGINENLFKQIETTVKYLSPLGTLVLNEQFPDDEKAGIEGRGIYHDIPFHERILHLYAKGVGSHFSINEGAQFPGYPQDPNDLSSFFIDRFSTYAEKSRIYGMLSISQALLEMLEATVIFIQLAKKNNWTSLDDVIDAGVSLPLIVFDFNELSTDTQNKLSDAHSDNDWTRTQMGSILSITPSSRRIHQTFAISNTVEQDYYDNVKNPKMAYTCGKTLRTLLEIGYVFEPGSTHLQNMYASEHATCAQADSGDLLCLGESKFEDIQQELIVAQLSDKHYLWPITMPWMPEEGKLSIDDVLECQRSFLKGLLDKDVSDHVVDMLASLMPTAKNEVMLAISHFLMQKTNKGIWKETATIQKDLLETINDPNLTDSAQDHTRKTNTLHGLAIKRIAALLSNEDALPFQIGETLKAKPDQIDNHYRLINIRRKVLEKAKTLDPEKRDRLLSALGSATGAYDIKDIDPYDNPLVQNEYQVFQHLIELIETDYDEALAFVHVIGIITKKYGSIIVGEFETEYSILSEVLKNETTAQQQYEYIQLAYECNILIKLFTSYVQISDRRSSINTIYQTTLCENLKEEIYESRHNENVIKLKELFENYNSILSDLIEGKIQPNEASSLLTKIVAVCNVQSILDLHKHITSFLVEEKSS